MCYLMMQYSNYDFYMTLDKIIKLNRKSHADQLSFFFLKHQSITSVSDIFLIKIGGKISPMMKLNPEHAAHLISTAPLG